MHLVGIITYKNGRETKRAQNNGTSRHLTKHIPHDIYTQNTDDNANAGVGKLLSLTTENNGDEWQL
jgi:hypothetical protein